VGRPSSQNESENGRVLRKRVLLALPWVVLAGGLLLYASMEEEASPAPDAGVTPDAAPTPTGQGRLSVYVRDEAGGPIAGAAVTIRMRFDNGVTLVREGISDETGAAVVGELPEGEATVFAVEGDRARGHARAVVVDGEGEASIVLGPGQDVRGRVLDETGAAIVDATLEARPVADDAAPPWTTHTDGEGRFTFSNLMTGPQRILARAEGYDEIARRVVPRPRGDEADDDGIRIILRRTGVMAGSVRTADGAPAPTTRVVLVGSGVWPPRSAEADSDGHYRFEGVPEGIYELRARRGADVASPREGLLLGAGESLDIDLTLEPGAVLEGVVVAAEGLAPIAGAEVVIGEESLSFSPRATTTGDDGGFVFDGLRALPHRLDVFAPGYVSIDSHMAEPGGEALRFLLEREATVSGVVVDALDHPLEGVRVELVGTSRAGAPVAISGATASFQRALVAAQVSGPEPVEASGELGVTLGPIPPLPSSAIGAVGAAPEAGGPEDEAATPAFETNAEGRFSITGVPAGRYQIVGRHPDHAPGIGAAFVIESGATREDERLVLPAGAAVDGRVVDSRGFPVPHVRVEMHCEREPFARWALAGDDGTFAFAGALETCVFGAYPAGRPAARKTLSIEGGEAVEIELALTDEIATFYARVVDEDEYPVAGARVSIRSLRADAPARRTTWASDDGSVEVPGMPMPPWRVEIDQEGYALEVVGRITSAEGEHQLVVHPAASVVGRVLDGWDQSPVAEARVVLSRSRGAPFEGTADETGTFELSRVPVGNYTIRIEAPELLTHNAEARLVASRTGLEDLDVGDISLSAGGSLRGEVVDALGATVAGAEVAAGAPPAWEAAVRTDAEGAFLLSGLTPGDASLTARHPGAGTSAPLAVRVRAREETPGAVLRLPSRFDPERAAEGGDRQTGVAITLRDRGATVRIATVRPDSAAARAGLRPRDVLLSADGYMVRSAAEGLSLLRGPVGTEVLVEVRRGRRTEVIAVQREAYRD